MPELDDDIANVPPPLAHLDDALGRASSRGHPRPLRGDVPPLPLLARSKRHELGRYAPVFGAAAVPLRPWREGWGGRGRAGRQGPRRAGALLAAGGWVLSGGSWVPSHLRRPPGSARRVRGPRPAALWYHAPVPNRTFRVTARPSKVLRDPSRGQESTHKGPRRGPLEGRARVYLGGNLPRSSPGSDTVGR